MTARQQLELGISLALGGAGDIVIFGARVNTWSGPVALGCFVLGYLIAALSIPRFARGGE